MKKPLAFFISLSFSFFLSSIVVAQDSRISTNSELLPDGHVRFVVTNRSGQAITGLYVLGEGTPLVNGVSRIVYHRYFDSVVDPFGEKDLGPLQDRVFVLAGPRPGPNKLRTDVALKAALFADGTSWGSENDIQILVSRRKTQLVHVRKALGLLQDAQAKGTARDQLIQQFQGSQDSEPKVARSVEERDVIRGIYREVLTNLQLDTGDGSPVPGLTVQKRLTAIVSQLEQRRHKLLASKPPLEDVSAETNPVQ